MNVRLHTCTSGVYGDLGRYPLFISRYVRIINSGATLLWQYCANKAAMIIIEVVKTGYTM